MRSDAPSPSPARRCFGALMTHPTLSRRRHMIDREISRREMLATTAGAIAGLTLTAGPASFGQEKQEEKTEETAAGLSARRLRLDHRQAVRSGAPLPWPRRSDSTAFRSISAGVPTRTRLCSMRNCRAATPRRSRPRKCGSPRSRWAFSTKSPTRATRGPRSGWTRPSTWPGRCGSGSFCWPSSARAISRTTRPARTPW